MDWAKLKLGLVELSLEGKISTVEKLGIKIGRCGMETIGVGLLT